MENSGPPNYLVFGNLRRMYLLPPNGKARIDKPGGNLLYTAAGLSLWEESIGLVSRVGEDFPRSWLAEFERRKLDIRGIKILPQAVDLRTFFAYSDVHTRHTDNPVAHFARREIPFPRSLFGYRDTSSKLDDRNEMTELSIRQNDIPPEYLHATVAHFCPQDYLTHSLMPAALRQAGFTTLTLDPNRGYMDPAFWEQIPGLINGLTAFLPSEAKLRQLFHGRSDDLWEMAQTLAAYGCDFIVIKRAIEGQLLYDADSKTRWEIPAYPSREMDPTGAGDAFCGGFLAGYRNTYDPLEAALHGNVAASLAIEGSGPFYALDALPGLAQARLDVLRQSIRKI